MTKIFGQPANLRYHLRNNGPAEPEDEQMTNLLCLPHANRVLAALGLTVMIGCASPAQVTRAGQDAIGPLANPAMVDTALGTCFARATTPAIIETVTEQVMVQPANVSSDGVIQSPAAFRTVTRQQILRERREVEFETPCNTVQTPQFIASVQRALIARGYYRGTITGVMDPKTSAAIERFQIAQDDVHTNTLTLRSARALGLVAQPRDAQ